MFGLGVVDGRRVDGRDDQRERRLESLLYRNTGRPEHLATQAIILSTRLRASSDDPRDVYGGSTAAK